MVASFVSSQSAARVVEAACAASKMGMPLVHFAGEGAASSTPLRPPPLPVGTLTSACDGRPLLSACPLVARAPTPGLLRLPLPACPSSKSHVTDFRSHIAALLPVSAVHMLRPLRSRPRACFPCALPLLCTLRVPPLPLCPWLGFTCHPPSACATFCSIWASCSAAPTRRHSHGHRWPRSTANSQVHAAPCSLYCRRSPCPPPNLRPPRRLPPFLLCLPSSGPADTGDLEKKCVILRFGANLPVQKRYKETSTVAPISSDSPN